MSNLQSTNEQAIPSNAGDLSRHRMGEAMSQRKIGKAWLVWGRYKKSTAFGFNISSYGVTLELLLFYVGIEF